MIYGNLFVVFLRFVFLRLIGCAFLTVFLTALAALLYVDAYKDVDISIFYCNIHATLYI